MKKRDKANYLIQSVSHSLDVLEALAESNGEIGVTELAKKLKLHKNNVFRLLATLELRGYAEQNADTENYRLGVRNLQLGQAFVKHSRLIERARPIMQQLVDATGETVSLAVLQNGYVQFPVSIESKRAVKVTARQAVSFPAKTCAAGRLLTAQLNDAQLQELLATNTPQDVAIKNQLSDLRSSGIIVDRGATEADVVTVAKIIRSQNNQIVGAVELTAPQYRSKVEALIPLVEEAAQNLSEKLGSIRPQSSGLAAGIQVEQVSSKPAVMPLGVPPSAQKSQPMKTT